MASPAFFMHAPSLLLRSLPILAVLAFTLSGCSEWHTSTGAATADPAARGTWEISAYTVRLDEQGDLPGAPGIEPVGLSIHHTPTRTPLFETLPGEAPLIAQRLALEPPGSRPKRLETCRLAHFTRSTASSERVTIEGHLTCGSGARQDFTLTLAAGSGIDSNTIALTVELGVGPANQVTLRAATDANEQVFSARTPAGGPTLKGKRLKLRTPPPGTDPAPPARSALAALFGGRSDEELLATLGGVAQVTTSLGRGIAIDSADAVTLNFADPLVLQFEVIGRKLHSQWQTVRPTAPAPSASPPAPPDARSP